MASVQTLPVPEEGAELEVRVASSQGGTPSLHGTSVHCTLMF